MNKPSPLPHNQGTSMNEALHRATLLLAAFAVLLALILNIPDNRIIEAYTTQALVYVSLTAFALFFGSRLSQGMITSAHVVGMVALLSLPEGAFPFMLWTTFFGAVGGIVIKRFYARTSDYSVYIADVIFTAAQVVLSFFAAGRVYIALDGSLPLESVSWDNNSSIFIALTAYVIVYVALYVAFFALRLFVEGKSVTKVARSNLSVLTIVLLLPIPFAIVSGEIANNLNQPVEILSLIGLALIILGLHTFSRSRYLFRKQLQEIQTFSDITRAMRSHLELPVLLMTIYQQVGKLLGIDNFVIALHVPERNRLEYPLAIVGGQETVVSMDKLPAVCADSLVSHVLETTEPLLLSDHVQTQAQGLNLAPPSDEIMSWIGAPLTAGGNTFGVIAAMSDSPNQHFSADDLRLLNIIASSASVAIENAQLYRRQKDRAEQLSTLSRVGALLSGTLSSDTVLDIVISSASTIADANSIAVYLFAGDDQTDLRLARSAGLTEVFTDDPPVPALVSDESAIRPYQPLAISDVMADKRGESLRTLMKREHKQALVELPLVIGEDTLGIIALYYDDTQFFDSSRLEYMRTYATQAAQAIQNANTYSITDKAFQRSVDQLLTLATIGRELTSTVNLRENCTSILDSEMRATRINVGLVALQDINGQAESVSA
jgi:GAF domain-containing protein